MAERKTSLDSVGGRLQYARRCRKYGQALVAKYTRLAPETLKRYERSEIAIPIELVKLLAFLYDVPLAWVLDADGDVPVHPPAPRTPAQQLMGRCFDVPPEMRLKKRFRETPVSLMLLGRRKQPAKL